RAQRLHADGGETDDRLGVVGQCLDADHRPDTELSVPHAHTRTKRQPTRLIFVLVGIRRLFFPHTIAAPAAVWIRPELVMREVALIWRLGKGRHDTLDELGRDFVDEPRRFAGLVLAEDAPARG